MCIENVMPGEKDKKLSAEHLLQIALPSLVEANNK